MKFVVEILDHGLVKLSPLPARLTLAEVSRLLNIHADDISFLVREEELTALGSPAKNQEKFFDAGEVHQKSQDARWLARVTKRIYQRYQEKNGAKVIGS